MPVQLRKKAVDGSSILLEIEFLDFDKDPLTPNTFYWTLTDENKNVINNRTNISVTPTSNIIKVLLYGDDILYADGGCRVFTFSGVYDSTLGNDIPYVEEATFYISDVLNK